MSEEGFVYILTSPNTDCIKIGGSDYPPSRRIREINSTEPYKQLGPWSLADFRKVKNWRKVESHFHYAFRSKLNVVVTNQKELFHAGLHDASEFLESIEPEEIIGKPKVDRMFQDTAFLEYVKRLFMFTGLMNWLDLQGAWTFTLFPGTSGGRYFTINIGPHEVAYSTLGRRHNELQQNMILVDRLIFDFGNVVNWVATTTELFSWIQYSTDATSINLN